MMVLESCNVDISTKIICAGDSFTHPSLSYYTGQNVANLATTTLKPIKGMQQRYAPTVDLVSKLLLKVSDTACVYFNRQVFNHLEKALILE